MVPNDRVLQGTEASLRELQVGVRSYMVRERWQATRTPHAVATWGVRRLGRRSGYRLAHNGEKDLIVTETFSSARDWDGYCYPRGGSKRRYAKVFRRIYVSHHRPELTAL